MGARGILEPCARSREGYPADSRSVCSGNGIRRSVCSSYATAAMSKAQQVYVALLDEGVECWCPVGAQHIVEVRSGSSSRARTFGAASGPFRTALPSSWLSFGSNVMPNPRLTGPLARIRLPRGVPTCEQIPKLANEHPPIGASPSIAQTIRAVGNGLPPMSNVAHT
jgi:hypothetical protein